MIKLSESMLAADGGGNEKLIGKNHFQHVYSLH